MSKCKKVQSSCNLTTFGPGPSQIRRVVFLWRARLFALPSSQSTCSSPSLYVLGAGARARARARARALYACSCGRGRSLCSSKRASLARVCALGAWWLLGRCLRIRAEGAWWRAAARGRRALCHATRGLRHLAMQGPPSVVCAWSDGTGGHPGPMAMLRVRRDHCGNSAGQRGRACAQM